MNTINVIMELSSKCDYFIDWFRFLPESCLDNFKEKNERITFLNEWVLETFSPEKYLFYNQGSFSCVEMCDMSGICMIF